MDFHHESMMSVTLDDFILSANEQLSGFSAIHRELNGWPAALVQILQVD